MEFTVRRRGPPSASQAEYQFDQPNGGIDQRWRPLDFDPNGTARPVVPAGAYQECADPPLVRIRDGDKVAEAAASFSAYEPDECKDRRGILAWLQDHAPWWPIPAAILTVAAAAYSIRKIFFPPAPALYPTWSIDSDPSPPEAAVRKMPEWPKFSYEVTIEWGGAILPPTLPIAEADDG
jgi:hypothetical protein